MKADERVLVLMEHVARKKDGTIEFDIAFSEATGFPGIAFRATTRDTGSSFHGRSRREERRQLLRIRLERLRRVEQGREFPDGGVLGRRRTGGRRRCSAWPCSGGR